MNSIGRYQLTEKLGQGGMGVVYRAFDTLLQRVVAVKLISGPIQAGPDQRERFFREARAAGQLSHRNIIIIHDLGEHEGQPYLAMEYLQGEDLQRRLARPEPMTLGRKVELAVDICDALEYAHARGVVHRDIKPANIFITESGTAKILDFGLARLMTSELTNSNTMMGTVNYMAPEQVRGERADHRSDIFSAGVVLYELLGGRRAFEAESFAATLYKILQETPVPLDALDPRLPPDLVAIVERAMAKPREERYQHMSEMLEALAACRQQLPVSEGPAVGRPPSGGQVRPSDPPHLRPLSDPDAPTIAHGRTPLPGPSRTSGTPDPSLAPASAAPPPEPRSRDARPSSFSRRTIGIAAGAVAVFAIVGFALWSALSPGRAPAEDRVASAAASAPDAQVAVAAALREAMQALDTGDFEAAQRHADEALAAEPGHAEARRVRERATTALDEVTAGFHDARAHYDAGRYEDASRMAGDVLELVPGHAGARQLMQDAAARSQGRGVAEARTRMARAKEAARGADAASLASAAYDAALGAERTAQRLYDAGQLADATARFYEASGLFRSAELSARSEAARLQRAQAAQAAQAEKERAEAARLAQLPRPAMPVSPPAAPPPVTSRVDQTPVEIAPAPPPPRAPSPPAAPVEAARPEPSPDSLIAALLTSYEAALESQSLSALKELWPTLGGSQESAIRNEFAHASRIDVEIGTPRIEVSGSTATAAFLRRYALVTTDGQRLNSQSMTTISLRHAGDRWVITQIRFEPIR